MVPVLLEPTHCYWIDPKAGHQVVVVDNLVNSNRKEFRSCWKESQELRFLSIEQIFVTQIPSEDIFKKQEEPTGVIHFAGLKAVGESTHVSLLPVTTISLELSAFLKAMEENNKTSSSVLLRQFTRIRTQCAHLGRFPLSVTNPYGRTKLILEKFWLIFTKQTQNGMLSCFVTNLIGAHEWWFGRKSNGIPNNLLPYVTQVAIGKLEQVQVFGDSWYGKMEQVFVTVSTLSIWLRVTLQLWKNPKRFRTKRYNLGTGKGYSVLEIIKTWKKR